MVKKFLLSLVSAMTIFISPAMAKDAVFTLTSPDIKDHAVGMDYKDDAYVIGKDYVFNGFGCTGLNLSPALNWANPPKDTKSFALTMYDPDAPTGSGWWHWLVYNIPADATSLGKGAGSGQADLPAGAIMGKIDYGTTGYGGPCPPVGDKPHRYIFTLFALKVEKIDVPADASAAMIGFNLNANKIETATFTGIFGR